MENKVNLIKKMAPRTIMELTGAEMKKADHDGELFKIVGYASGLKSGESNYGPWESLTGEFQAVRSSDGKRFYSNNLFLPDVAHDLIAAQVKAGNEKVEFAFSIGSEKDDSSATGYIYTATPLIETRESDPFAHLMDAAGIGQIEENAGKKK